MGKNNTHKKDSFHEEMIKEWNDALIQRKEIPWLMPWSEDGWAGAPYNPVSGTKYSGANRIVLTRAMAKYNGDPRFVTFCQMKMLDEALEKKATDKEGYAHLHIEKGQHGVRIEKWACYDRETRQNIGSGEAEHLIESLGTDAALQRIYWYNKPYTVFNAKQIANFPEFEKPVSPVRFEEEEKIIDFRNRYIDGLGVGFREFGDESFYNPTEDYIQLPEIARFSEKGGFGPEGYLSTLFHEGGHATGHESRMGRTFGVHGTERYAIEELYAEMSAAFLCQDLGISTEELRKNGVAYIKSWTRAIEKDPNLIFRAAKTAEEIERYEIAAVGLENDIFHPVTVDVLPGHGPRLFVDIDGTLCTFDPQSDTSRLYTEGYFGSRPPQENVIGAIKTLANENRESVYILSAYLEDSPYALEEKKAWIKKYLPEIPEENQLFVACGKNKSEVVPGGVGKDDWLLDDYTKNLLEWEGSGIKLLNDINHTHGTWEGNRIYYGQEAGQIEKKIRTAMARDGIVRDTSPHIEATQSNPTPFLRSVRDGQAEEMLRGMGQKKTRQAEREPAQHGYEMT